MSNQGIKSGSSTQEITPQSAAEFSTHKGGYLLIALGVIALIGSLAAAGCLYSQLGDASFILGGAGVAFCILTLLLGKYCCVNTATISDSNQPKKKDTPKDTHIRVDEVLIQKSEQPQPRSDPTSQLPKIQPSTTTNVEPPKVAIAQEKKADTTPQITATPPKIKQPDLTQLPHIFSLKLDDSSPLLKALPSTQFIKLSQGNSPRVNADSTQQVQETDLDDALLDIPLSFWIKRSPRHYGASGYLKVISDPRRKVQVEVINARIQDLDQAIQIKERFQRLKNVELTVGDLLPAWGDLRVKLTLMMDDELSSLKVSSLVQQDNKIVWEVLGERLLALSTLKKECVLPANFTKESIGEMLLIDLPKLKLQHIYAYPGEFPPITFLLIDVSELKQIKTERLSAGQLHLIFSSVYFLGGRSFKKYHVHLLTPTQINACILSIKDKKVFANLNDEQALKFDFDRIDQEIFNAVFNLSPADSSKAKELLPKLTIDLIYKLSPFFSKDHWKHIGDEHTLIFDFSKIEESKRQEVFNTIFAPTGIVHTKTMKLLSQLNIDQIYVLSPLFSKEYWKCIGEKHTLIFDFSKIEESKRQEVFDLIFPIRGFTDLQLTADQLFPKLTIHRIYELIPFFSEEHWEGLNKEHTLSFDFSKIEESKRKRVFNILFTTNDNEPSKAAELLPKLSTKQAAIIRSYLLPEALKYLK